VRYGNQRRFSEIANHSGPPSGGHFCTADRGDIVMKVKWDQVRSDAQFLYLMSVPGQIGNIREAYSSYSRGDYAAARQASSRGLQAATANAAVGLALANPTSSYRLARGGARISGGPAGEIYRKLDFYQDIYKEYKRGDLEAKDFVFEMIPSMSQMAIKRYTTYDESRPTKSYEVVASNSTNNMGKKVLRKAETTKRSKRSLRAAVKGGRCRYTTDHNGWKYQCTKRNGHTGYHKYTP
jgi:hypothetical protein